MILNGRDTTKLADAVTALLATGAVVHDLPFDATDHAAVRAAVDAFEARVGPIDILVNNAGMQFRTELENFPADKFQALLQTNIATVFNVGQAVARHMIGRKAGQDHQHRLGPDGAGPAQHRALYRDQGRGGQPDQGHGDRLGEARAAMQRDCAGVFRHAAERRIWSRTPSSPNGWKNAHPPGAGARSRNWSGPACSWPGLRPAL